MKYVIKMTEGDKSGYYGKVMWGFSNIEDAKTFDTMKGARKIQNRLNSRLMKSSVSEIEEYEET